MMFRALGSYLRNQRRSLYRWFQNFRLPRLLTFDFYLEVIAWPFRFIIGAWKEGRIRDLLLGLPALVVFCFVSYLLGTASRTQVSNQYWAGARESLQTANYPVAELQLERVIKEGKGHVGDAQFALARMYDELGATERASAIFALLAPDDQRGYALAHRRLAVILSESISPNSSKDELERLHWHLKSGQVDNTPDTALAWGRYCIATRDIEQARKYFRIAVKGHGDAWKTLADIERLLGNAEAARTSYKEAARVLSERVRTRPSDHRARVDYADTLINLGNLEEARIVLEEGERFAPEEQKVWNRLLSSLYVNFHDVLVLQQKATIGDLMIPLGKALSYDPNFGPALNRLMSYAKANVDGNVELRAVLSRTVAEGKNPGLAHLALGNLCWLEGNIAQAIVHFERARKIDKDLSVVMNNLAWIIAHDEDNPDYERALTLVNQALEGRPNDMRFIDTRGTIYFLMKDWSKAVDDLEKAMPVLDDKRPTHRMLAVIYEEMKMTEIADEHRRLANE